MEQAGNLVYLIKHIELALRPRFEELCGAAGLTAAQFTALTVLRRRPGITSSELARRSFVRPQTMAVTLDPLLEAEFIRREQDPSHGRKFLLYLEPKGEQKIAELTPQVEELEASLAGDMTAAERRHFSEYLRRARTALDDRA